MSFVVIDYMRNWRKDSDQKTLHKQIWKKIGKKWLLLDTHAKN